MRIIWRRRTVWIAITALLVVVAAVAVAVRWMMQRPLFTPGTVAERAAALGEPLDPPAAAEATPGYWQVTPRIALRHVSVGAGPDVLVVHGGPGLPPQRPWRVADLTADTFRWHFYDQRGTGGSTRPIVNPPAAGVWRAMQEVEGRLGLAAQVADIERIRRLLGREQLVLVGHSFGALIAALYAAEWPERVAALVLIAPAPLFEMPAGDGDLFALVRGRLTSAQQPEFDRYMEEYFDFPRLLSRDDATLARFFQRFSRYYQEAAGTALPPASDLEQDVRAGGFMTLGVYLSLGRRHDWTSWMKRVRAHTVVLHGADDLQPRAATERVARALPNARFIEIAGASHFMYDERPAEVAKALREAAGLRP
jgi:proline iminopeptidase